MALEFQGRQPGLGLADEVDREKLPRQRQLGAAEQRTGGQRGLTMAGVTLVQVTAATEHDAVGGCVAAWADEAAWPTSAAYGFGTGGFRAETLKKLRQRHALLELDGVVCHDVDSWVKCHQPTRAAAH